MLDEAIIKQNFHNDKRAWAYIIMHHCVGIRIWDPTTHSFKPKLCSDELANIIEMRIFNSISELRIIVDGSPKIRYISDDGQTDFIDRDYLCFGAKAENKDGYTKLTDERGGVLCFPKRVEFSDNTRLWLTVRNYTRFNDIDINNPVSNKPPFEIYDYRFVGFKYGRAYGEDNKVVKI
jgi:CRISPR-associated protein (TIGR03984 family)